MIRDYDYLVRKMENLEFQKAETYKLDNLESTVRHLKEQITHLQNEQSYFRERIQSLEDRLNNCGE